jgi:GNAT superfamily N-acetyltransferase
LHGSLYAAEYGWDASFERYVAEPLAEFAARGNPRERIWIVENSSAIVGCIAIVEATPHEAQLRWFLLHPLARGRGLGRTLARNAVEFARSAGYRSVFLWTVRELEAAARVYVALGFRVTDESTCERWGATVTEQRYQLDLA